MDRLLFHRTVCLSQTKQADVPSEPAFSTDLHRLASQKIVWNMPRSFYYREDGVSPWVCVPKKPNTPILIAEQKTGWGWEKAICKCELSDNGSESWAINQNAPLIIISEKRWLSVSAWLYSPAGAFSCSKSTSTQERVSSPEKSTESSIKPAVTKPVCKHFFMLITSNMRANVKLI